MSVHFNGKAQRYVIHLRIHADSLHLQILMTDQHIDQQEGAATFVVTSSCQLLYTVFFCVYISKYRIYRHYLRKHYDIINRPLAKKRDNGKIGV